MDGGKIRRAHAPCWRTARRKLALIAASALALGCTACNSTTTQAPVVRASAAGGLTVAFESVDGPPESIYTKLVRSLSDEAEARQIAVVSRGAPAHYRVRIYAATIVYPKRSVVQWVWDVYDGNQQRAHRLTGEEPVTGAGRNTWAAADDQLIRKIARAGMDRLIVFLGTPPREPAPAPPPPTEGPAIAMAPEH